MLRPTNLLVWTALVTSTVLRSLVGGISSTMVFDYLIILREATFCGVTVITISAISDRFYFGTWTFPPYQFLYFNISQSLAVFYGVNDWHYYLSQGIPLLLTTYVPFAGVALWSASSISPLGPPTLIANVRFDLTFMILSMITTLSLISHKEVRFIYPLLPALHVLIAPHILAFFGTAPLVTTEQSVSTKTAVDVKIHIKPWRLCLLIIIALTNCAIGWYTARFHQRGVIDVLAFLRHEFEVLHVPQHEIRPSGGNIYATSMTSVVDTDSNETFAGFLMPCHSTPWRSHLVYPKLKAWALTCEPPLHIPPGTPERAAYRDEADRFYDDPTGFLEREVNTTGRPWPRYIVGFEGIEPVLKNYYEAKNSGGTVRER